MKFEEDLPNITTPLKRDPSFRQALRFATGAKRARLQGYCDAQEERFAREAEEKRMVEEAERKRVEAEKAEASRKRMEAEKAEAERKRIEAEKVKTERQCREAKKQEMFEKASSGDAVAQFILGNLYRDGIDMLQNSAEAMRWYRAAAEQGHAGAQYILAGMCDKGEGVVQNSSETVRWYRAAAEQGVAQAQNILGYKYATGEGVSIDRAEAAKWYCAAAESGKNLPDFMTCEITDSWEEIIAAIDNGTAVIRYAVGAWKSLYLREHGNIRMQLVGFKLDDSANGYGMAATTWLAMDLLNALDIGRRGSKLHCRVSPRVSLSSRIMALSPSNR